MLLHGERCKKGRGGRSGDTDVGFPLLFRDFFYNIYDPMVHAEAHQSEVSWLRIALKIEEVDNVILRVLAAAFCCQA